MRRKALCTSLISTVLALTCGCSSEGYGRGSESDVSSVTFAQIVGGDFTGNSVMITGSRELAADSKYSCSNEVAACFPFNADGTLGTSLDGAFSGGFQGLCPSVNLPTATWDFTYEIFLAPDCTGEILNAEGNPNDFVCYDIQDLATQTNANMSADQTLELGLNANPIVCATEGAEKVWDVLACFRTAPGVDLFDCGCTGMPCECGDIVAEDLPDGCEFDESCNIDCE